MTQSLLLSKVSINYSIREGIKEGKESKIVNGRIFIQILAHKQKKKSRKCYLKSKTNTGTPSH